METRVRTFIRGVYGWMFGGLLLTTLASLWVVNSPSMKALVLGNPIVMFGLMFVELGIVLFLSFRITKMTAGAAASAFLVYSFLNGLTLSMIFFAYSGASIAQAFLVSAGMFGAMSVYGLVTKRDLTSWGSFFFMGLIGIILCSVVNIFIHSSGLSFVVSILGVFIFLGLTAWDNQKLKVMATVTGPLQENFAVIGALALYLDFINLFLFLLRLFGNRRQ
ncbi:MAG TPA: Bax inhibitor-1/YccA family protein [Thermoanaerobaculia bacterium]|nr:Bax inhibitor-1/YccA family protein [Thermoanaerobaculia bacterium]